jgi:hypothetical protein
MVAMPSSTIHVRPHGHVKEKSHSHLFDGQQSKASSRKPNQMFYSYWIVAVQRQGLQVEAKELLRQLPHVDLRLGTFNPAP